MTLRERWRGKGCDRAGTAPAARLQPPGGRRPCVHLRTCGCFSAGCTSTMGTVTDRASTVPTHVEAAGAAGRQAGRQAASACHAGQQLCRAPLQQQPAGRLSAARRPLMKPGTRGRFSWHAPSSGVNTRWLRGLMTVRSHLLVSMSRARRAPPQPVPSTTSRGLRGRWGQSAAAGGSVGVAIGGGEPAVERLQYGASQPCPGVQPAAHRPVVRGIVVPAAKGAGKSQAQGPATSRSRAQAAGGRRRRRTCHLDRGWRRGGVHLAGQPSRGRPRAACRGGCSGRLPQLREQGLRHGSPHPATHPRRRLATVIEATTAAGGAIRLGSSCRQPAWRRRRRELQRPGPPWIPHHRRW